MTTDTQITDALDADDWTEAARRLKQPRAAVTLCGEHGPWRYADLCERVVHAADTETADRLAILAGAVRLDARAISSHPARVIPTVVNRCRWYSGIEDVVGDRTPEIPGVDTLIERWRDWHAENADTPLALALHRPWDSPRTGYRQVIREGAYLKDVTRDAEGRLYSLDKEARLTAYDADGDVRWRTPLTGMPQTVGYNEALGSLVAILEAENDDGVGTAVDLVDPETGSVDRRLTVPRINQPGLPDVARRAPYALVGGANTPARIHLETADVEEFYDDKVYRGALHDDGRLVALGRLHQKDVLVFDLDRGEQWRIEEPERGFESHPSRIAFGDDKLAVVDAAGIPRVWEADEPQLIGDLHCGEQSATDAAFGPDDRHLAIAWQQSTAHGDSVTVYNADNGDRIGRHPGGTVYTASVTFADPETLVTAGYDGAIRVGPATGDRVEPHHTEPAWPNRVCTAALDATRHLAALGTRNADDPVFIYDLDDGKVVTRLDCDETPDALAFSDDGNELYARVTEPHPAILAWDRVTHWDWERYTDHSVDPHAPFTPSDLTERVHLDPDRGTTHLPNPLDPDTELTWPEPLLVMDHLDALYLQQDCPYILAHTCNRLTILEVDD